MRHHCASHLSGMMTSSLLLPGVPAATASDPASTPRRRSFNAASVTLGGGTAALDSVAETESAVDSVGGVGHLHSGRSSLEGAHGGRQTANMLHSSGINDVFP